MRTRSPAGWARRSFKGNRRGQGSGDWGRCVTLQSLPQSPVHWHMNRRLFLKTTGIALAGSALTPNIFAKMAAASTANGKKTLVAIFQRGAVDGLNMIVPYGESAYYSARPSIAIPKTEVLDLDGFFGAHPSLRSLMPFWKDRSLAIVHAAGSPDSTRSHFDAQDFMESGTPGVKSTEDGFRRHRHESWPDRPRSRPRISPRSRTPRRRSCSGRCIPRRSRR